MAVPGMDKDIKDLVGDKTQDIEKLAGSPSSPRMRKVRKVYHEHPLSDSSVGLSTHSNSKSRGFEALPCADHVKCLCSRKYC